MVALQLQLTFWQTLGKLVALLPHPQPKVEKTIWKEQYDLAVTSLTEKMGKEFWCPGTWPHTFDGRNCRACKR